MRVKKFVNNKWEDTLLTVDLICHGTPSPAILEKFLEQYKLSLDTMKEISFRKNTRYQIYSGNKSVITEGVTDSYSIAFLQGLIFTDNCYTCPYAGSKRVSDITLGDSWGSRLPEDEKRRGISLILCQTEKGIKLLEQADMHLEDVDISNAIESNHQLKAPAVMPKNRIKFLKQLQEGEAFNKLVLANCPKQYFKQNIKKTLIKLHVLKGG